MDKPTNPADAKVVMLEAEVARLYAALLPFANHAKDWEGFHPSEPLVEDWPDGPENLPLTVGDLFNARVALNASTY